MTGSPNIKIIRSRRRSLSLHVLSDGSLEIKAPWFIPRPFINDFIEKHSEWIEKRKKIVQKKQALKKSYSHGESYLYLGKEYILDIGNYSEITIEDNKLLFPIGLKFRAKKELENWYIRQARELITAAVDRYAKEMETEYTHITFSDTKSQWGRCTSDNRLQFSWRLIMTPLLVLNYVVIHELAHTKYKNHGIRFWNTVRAVMPSYKQQIKWLKENGNTLVV